MTNYFVKIIQTNQEMLSCKSNHFFIELWIFFNNLWIWYFGSQNLTLFWILFWGEVSFLLVILYLHHVYLLGACSYISESLQFAPIIHLAKFGRMERATFLLLYMRTLVTVVVATNLLKSVSYLSLLRMSPPFSLCCRWSTLEGCISC